MRLKFVCSVCLRRQRVCWLSAMTAAFLYRIILHDGGDVWQWRALAGVVEICRPVNSPPRRINVRVKSVTAVNPRDQNRAI